MADREEFQKKLAELLAKAAAQGNRMTQEELAAFFRDENLTEEQMELVVEFLMAQKIEVAGYTGHASEKAGGGRSESQPYRAGKGVCGRVLAGHQ